MPEKLHPCCRRKPVHGLKKRSAISLAHGSVHSPTSTRYVPRSITFLEPLLRKENLRIILTGAGTSAFIGDIIAPWLASHTGKNFSAVPTTDLVTNPMDYLNPAHPLLLISFGRSGNSPESVAAVELANQFVPECYHLPITCNEAGALYQNAINSDNAFALLMPAETHDRGFAMTSSITTMMASCLAVFAPETINSQTFRDVAGSLPGDP